MHRHRAVRALSDRGGIDKNPPCRVIRHKESTPEKIEFTMNGDEVLLIAAPKDVDLIAN